MTRKYLDCYINLVGNAMAGFERTDFSFERCSVMGEMLSKSSAYNRQIIHKRKSINVAYFIVVSL